VLLYKMEKIFPIGVFNPMQHLLIHFPYEAKVRGPVKYRWMYPKRPSYILNQWLALG
jgi:hypothetical protein